MNDIADHRWPAVEPGGDEARISAAGCLPSVVKSTPAAFPRGDNKPHGVIGGFVE